jgi:Arc/MetJ-type ribon-helix-helix transcriptional regulator
MNVVLSAKMKKFIADELKAGHYDKPSDIVLAAMQSLMQQSIPTFAPGEFDALLDEGEQGIAEHGTLDGETSFRARRRTHAARGLLRASSGKLSR